MIGLKNLFIKKAHIYNICNIFTIFLEWRCFGMIYTQCNLWCRRKTSCPVKKRCKLSRQEHTTYVWVYVSQNDCIYSSHCRYIKTIKCRKICEMQFPYHIPAIGGLKRYTLQWRATGYINLTAKYRSFTHIIMQYNGWNN